MAKKTQVLSDQNGKILALFDSGVSKSDGLQPTGCRLVAGRGERLDEVTLGAGTKKFSRQDLFRCFSVQSPTQKATLVKTEES